MSPASVDNGAVKVYMRVGHHGQLIKVAVIVIEGLKGAEATEHVAKELEAVAAKIRLDGQFMTTVHNGRLAP